MIKTKGVTEELQKMRLFLGVHNVHMLHKLQTSYIRNIEQLFIWGWTIPKVFDMFLK